MIKAGTLRLPDRIAAANALGSTSRGGPCSGRRPQSALSSNRRSEAQPTCCHRRWLPRGVAGCRGCRTTARPHADQRPGRFIGLSHV